MVHSWFAGFVCQRGAGRLAPQSQHPPISEVFHPPPLLCSLGIIGTVACFVITGGLMVLWARTPLLAAMWTLVLSEAAV